MRIHHVQLLLVLTQIEHAVSRRFISRGKACILTSFYQVGSSLENTRVKAAAEKTSKGKWFCDTQGPVYFSCEKIRTTNLRFALLVVGSFSNDDGDGNEDVKKAIGLLRKTTTLHVHHAFWFISLPSLHDYDLKMPNCKFYRGHKQATTNLFFSL